MALTSDACHKGLPKSATGEIPQFKGESGGRPSSGALWGRGGLAAAADDVTLFTVSVAGWPKLLWFVTESKHLSKPPRDWFPHIKDANNDTAYIEVSRQVTRSATSVCLLNGTDVPLVAPATARLLLHGFNNCCSGNNGTE